MAATEEDPRPHSLPSYPEMILTAITALIDKNGASKSAISKYIESSYAELPQSHASLLAAHLCRMTETGELVMVNESYFLAGPDAPPPKRGRGRPPKPKLPDTVGSTATATPNAAAAGAIPRRPRGRPPKPIDPLAPVKVPRPRGRPPKNASVAAGAASGTAGSHGEVKRPRGRPPKVRPQFAEVGFV